MKRLQTETRIDVTAIRVQSFRWQVGRFRLGQSRRFLRNAAFDADVQIDLDEERGWPWCVLYVTLRGTDAALDRAMQAIESVVTMEEE